MEEPQLRLSNDGELIEVDPKDKRKRRDRLPRFLTSRRSRLIAFGFAIAFLMLFSFLMGKGLVDLNLNQYSWYRQLCLNVLGKKKLAYFSGIPRDVYLTDESGSRSCPVIYQEEVSSVQWMPNGEQLAFFAHRASNASIQMINADDNHKVTLAEASGYPPFSTTPDGKNIIFTTPDGVYGVNVDDASVTLLYSGSNLSNVILSPDGKRIAIVSIVGKSSVSVANIDGSNLKQVLTTSLQVVRLYWSPDSKLIGFALSGGAKEEISQNGLYTMNPDGSNLRQLTQSSEMRNLAWSPDSRMIAYVGGTDILGVAVLDKPEQHYEMNLKVNVIAWSPDSSKLLYASGADYSQLYTLDPSDYQSKRLTNRGWRNWQPQWSSDGKFITYVSATNGLSDIYMMDANGNNVHQLTTDGAQKQLIGWQPQ
jgi:Tol biopolymer transport system component